MPGHHCRPDSRQKRDEMYHETTKGDFRVIWSFDEPHETRGSYGYDTEEETKAAEDHEIAQLSSGNWVALYATAQRRSPCDCPECSGWHTTETLHGIVIDNSESAFDLFARENRWLPFC